MMKKFCATLALLSLVWAGSAAGRMHTVRRGETLGGIARSYGVSLRQLVAANGLADPDIILAGSKLALPEAGAPAARTPAAPTPKAPPEARVETQPVAAVTDAGPPARPVAVPAPRARLRPYFVEYAKAAGVPADLAMALAWQESGWQTSRVSSTQAVGVMQLMPDTVEFVSRILLRQKTDLDPRDPAANIRMGTRFLRYLLDRNGGNVDLALASYYQGLRSVTERGVFDETRRFVANVKALRPRF